MSKSLRVFPRKDIEVDVELYFMDDSPQTVKTRDVSEGGLFMRLENPDHYPLGELVNVHYQNPLADNAAMEKDAVIVRTSSSGIAVAFIDMEAF